MTNVVSTYTGCDDVSEGGTEGLDCSEAGHESGHQPAGSSVQDDVDTMVMQDRSVTSHPACS